MKSLHIFPGKFLLKSGLPLMNAIESFLLLRGETDTLVSVLDLNVSHQLLLLVHNCVELEYLLDLVEIFFSDYLFHFAHSVSFSGQLARQDRGLEVLSFEFVN
jgi:hypothetical protein